MYTNEMLESIKKVEANREANACLLYTSRCV